MIASVVAATLGMPLADPDPSHHHGKRSALEDHHIKRFGRLVLTNGLQYSCNAYLIEEANFRINAKKIFQIFIEK